MTRLADRGDIDRSRRLRFRFDGRDMQGVEGDTLASALLANGVHLVGRSFKYHRPRGVYSAGVEEPNALVSIGQGAARIPNLQATRVQLCDGLVAQSQNRWPSLGLDFQALNQLAAPFLGAGFYYKTFMGRGHRAWMVYEAAIRRAAGLGRPPDGAAPGRAVTRHHVVDLLIIGGGLAGLAAACEAPPDTRVLLLEQDFTLGGAALATPSDSTERKALRDLLHRVAARANIEVFTRTQVFGQYDHGVFAAAGDGAAGPLHIIRAARCILASGAIERGIALPGNDLPGVMLAGAARLYANRFGVRVGQRVVLFGNNDSTFDAACDLKSAGCEVTLVDPRKDLPRQAIARLSRAGVAMHRGAEVVQAHGWRRLRAVSLADGTRLPADVLGLSAGWMPLVHLTSHLGHKPVWSEAHAAFLPGDLPADLPGGMAVRGAAAGDFRPVPGGPARADPGWTTPIRPVWSTGRGKWAFVDLQNDVTVKDIAQAHDEGFESVEHLKRYTTLGMGTDQGRLSNVIGLALMAQATGRSIPETGTTTFRPPFAPVALGTLAGDRTGADYHMRRRSPLHEENLRDGAEMIHSGLWDRAWFYTPNGTDVDSACLAEMRLVRGHAALCDVSSLGKIDIEGPDAAEFLDRIYANPFRKLPIGRARWGIMLRDDGYVFDDGTTSRLSEHRYFMTTTTAKAGQVLARMEFLLETAWPGLRVHVSAVTDHWAAMALAGPKARDVLGAVAAGDVSNAALPFLGVTETVRIAGVAVRILRVSFSGELSYEIYALAGDAPKVWRALRDAGAGVEGLEALGALRIEKGHIAGGEFDGTTTMDDLGLSSMFSRKKPFIGKVMAGREGLMAAGRLQLVGLEGEAEIPLRTGAVLSLGRFERTGDGRITSATYSPTLGRFVALGLLRDGRALHGKTVRVLDPARGGEASARVCSPHFLDPEGGRMRG